MARSRNIKPGFFHNEELGELDPLARLLFIGMWTIADFKGCIEFRPKKIKAQLLPYDDCNLEQFLINLERSRFIVIYSVLSQRYIKILNFEKHQNPHKNECAAGSDIPDYDKTANNINDIQKIEINPDQNGINHADSLIPHPDSLVLIPDSGFLIPDSNTKVKPLAAGSSTQPLPKKRGKKEPAPTAETWAAYSAAYLIRYAVDPVRNATVNGQLAQLVARLGAQEAPQVAGWYLSHRNQFYTSCGHSVGILLRDCEKLRTEWATGRQGTHAQAVQSDRTQTNLSAFAPMMAEALEREKLTGGKPE